MKLESNLAFTSKENTFPDRENGTETDDLSTPDYELRLAAAFRCIYHAMDVHSRRLSRETELNATQLLILQHIVRVGQCLPSELGRRLHLANGNMVGNLDQLEEKGYIARERSAIDRRKVIVTPTATGIAFVGLAPSPLQKTLSAVLASLRPRDRESIVSTVERLVTMMGIWPCS